MDDSELIKCAEITAGRYAALTEEERRMWRLYNIPRMTQDQVIDFYIECIKPLETSPEMADFIADDISKDGEYYEEYARSLQQEIDDASQQLQQLTSANALPVDSSHDEPLTSGADEME